MSRVFCSCFLSAVLLIVLISQLSANEPVPSLSSGCEPTNSPNGLFCTWYFPNYETAYQVCGDMVAEEFSTSISITSNNFQGYCINSSGLDEDGFRTVGAGNFVMPTATYFVTFKYPSFNSGYCENGTIDQLTGDCLGFALGVPDNPTGCGEANPCNPATGAKFQTETDMSINNQGLGFSRYYNSQGQYRDSKSLGPNWRHQYGGRLVSPAEEIAP